VSDKEKIDALEAELALLKQETHLHLGNMLDETRTTRRGEWPRALHCLDCGCIVSKLDAHKPSCRIGQALAFWDKLDDGMGKPKGVAV